MPLQIGFLYPGEMGAALATIARGNGHKPCWPSRGRGRETRVRAEAAGFRDLVSLQALCRECPAIISICPPHAAIDMANQVAAEKYAGLFVDANAISPNHAGMIGELIRGAGGRFVDGAVVGPPPRSSPAQTRLLLCGDDAREVADYFAGPLLEVQYLGPEPGKASALKICHSAMHKGQLALLLATLAAAEKLGVRSELEALWASGRSTATYVTDMPENVQRTRKGWRFSGEMLEAAVTLEQAGLPGEFHRAASDLFSRLPRPVPGSAITTSAELIETLLNGRR